jgi:hypothetical protein
MLSSARRSARLASNANSLLGARYIIENIGYAKTSMEGFQ